MVISRIEMEEGSDDGDDDDGVTDTDDRAGSTEEEEEEESSDDTPRRASKFAMVVVAAAGIRIMVAWMQQIIANRWRRVVDGVFLPFFAKIRTLQLRYYECLTIKGFLLYIIRSIRLPHKMVVGVEGSGSLLQKRIRATYRRSQWVQIF